MKLWIIVGVSVAAVCLATYLESKGKEAAKWAVLLTVIAGALIIGAYLR